MWLFDLKQSDKKEGRQRTDKKQLQWKEKMTECMNV